MNTTAKWSEPGPGHSAASACFEHVGLIGTRSAIPLRASGHDEAASTGRIHDRFRLYAENVQNSLAQRGPSIHDASGSLHGRPHETRRHHEGGRLGASIGTHRRGYSFAKARPRWPSQAIALARCLVGAQAAEAGGGGARQQVRAHRMALDGVGRDLYPAACRDADVI